MDSVQITQPTTVVPLVQEVEPDRGIGGQNDTFKSNLIDFLQSVIIAISVCIVIYIFLATPNQIQGQSMQPNFEEGEIVLTSKVHQWLGGTDVGKSLDLDYKKGDVVVFQKPGFDDFIKRVIAAPGDEIAIREGAVYVNNQKVQESYLSDDTYTNGGTFLEDDGKMIVVPSDHYFLMGDNRGNSHDSRYSDIGFIKREWLKGKVLVRYWPINKFEVVKKD